MRLGMGLCVALGLFASPSSGSSQHPEVLIVVNVRSDLSVAIGNYYREVRGVPVANVVELETATEAAVSRRVFETEIRDPVADFLSADGLADGLAHQIEILVTTRGIPLLVASEGEDGELVVDDTIASVDAELALLFSGRDGTAIAFGSSESANPYFEAADSFATFRREQPDSPLRYLVARLTGYGLPVDVATGVPRDVKALIDRAQEPAGHGRYLIDEDPAQPCSLDPGSFCANRDFLAAAADVLSALGLEVQHETSTHFASDVSEIAGYASWGSNDRQSPGAPYYGEISDALYPGSFAARALAVDFVSTNARTFEDDPTYGQSLIADLIALGVAGAAGHVFEPTLAAVAQPQILLPAYARGAPAAEAYFRSHRYLGWVNVYVGDPLMVCGDRASATCVRAPEPASNFLQLVALAALVAARRRAMGRVPDRRPPVD